MPKIKITLLVIVFLLFSFSVIAEDTIEQAEHTYQQIPSKYRQIFQGIDDAFGSNDYEKAIKLLDDFKLTSELEAHDKINFSLFNKHIADGNMAQAHIAANKILENDGLDIMIRARVHNALGDAYFYKDDLDNALAEYKKILDLGRK